MLASYDSCVSNLQLLKSFYNRLYSTQEECVCVYYRPSALGLHPRPNTLLTVVQEPVTVNKITSNSWLHYFKTVMPWHADLPSV